MKHGHSRRPAVAGSSCLLSGSAVVGAALWGAYALCRLAVIDVLAFRMLRQGCRIHDLTDRLLIGRGQVQRVMAALAVVVGTLFVLVVGR